MLFYEHGLTTISDSNTINTTISITCGFQPKALRFTWVGIDASIGTSNTSTTRNSIRGVGFATSTTSRRAVCTYSADAAAAATCRSIWSDTSCIILITTAIQAKVDINSIDSNGFTLIIDQALGLGAGSYVIKWEAWGGSDITNVTIGSIAEPAAIGTQNYTATGFVASPFVPDQCVMLAGVQTVNATDTIQTQDSGLYIGFATSTSTSNNIVLVGNSDDGSATMDTDSYSYTGECAGMIVIAGGNVTARATLSAYGADLFTLNWLARVTTNRRSIYMAIKGGLWTAGSTTIDGTTLNSTATISDFPFRMRGGCLMGAAKVTTSAGISNVEDVIGYGSFRKGQGLGVGVDNLVYRSYLTVTDRSALADSSILMGYNEDDVLGYIDPNTNNIGPEYNISFGGNSATLTTVTTGGVANEWIGYLVFGDNTTMTSVGHPFIL